MYCLFYFDRDTVEFLYIPVYVCMLMIMSYKKVVVV